jgi:hypothetical protein
VSTKFHSLRHVGAAEADYHVDCVSRISTSTAIGAGCSLEFELSLCVGEGSPASGAIPSRIESLGVRQRRLECRFGTFSWPASPTRVSAGARAARQLIATPSVPPPGHLRTGARPFSSGHGPASTDVMLRSNATPE